MYDQPRDYSSNACNRTSTEPRRTIDDRITCQSIRTLIQASDNCQPAEPSQVGLS